MILPRIGLTLGDVAGIGPEVVLKACRSPELRRDCRPVIIGHVELLRRASRQLNLPLELQPVARLEAIDDRHPGVPVWDPRECDATSNADDLLTVYPGQIHPAAGRAAYDWLIAAIDATRGGMLQAITTAPLNKAALHAAGVKHPGHTEILAERCGVAEHAMMLYLPPHDPLQSNSSQASPRGPFGLGVAHVTLHTSIRSVPDLLTSQKVAETAQLVDRFLRRVDCPSPRIAVCALNPHAGEAGLFGDEEVRIIQPGVEASRQSGLNVQGPFPADTLMRRALHGEFDGVVAMYHDQGHIALKLAAWHHVVNVTLGLPIIRTSPSHGTGFEIVGQGIADAEGFLQAVRVAAQLCGNRL